MQEKDIRKKLDQELDKMAPDILDKILATPMEPVKSEKELFGKNRPLFKEQKNWKQYLWAPAMVAVAVCIAIVVMIMQPSLVQPPKTNQTNVAFNIIIDVNPSISIDVKKDGTVAKITAGNKEAKAIVKKINEKIEDDTDYNKAVRMVVKQLNKNGYLQKKKNAMLVSVLSDDKKISKEKLSEIKTETKDVKEKKNIKCTTVYQVCEKSAEAVKVADKNNVSIGKAALCIKLAAKEKTSIKKMCKESIDTLVNTAEKNGTVENDNEIIIDDDMFIVETESTTFETESVSETESIEESSSFEEETSINYEENTTEEQTIEVTETMITEPLVN